MLDKVEILGALRWSFSFLVRPSTADMGGSCSIVAPHHGQAEQGCKDGQKYSTVPSLLQEPGLGLTRALQTPQPLRRQNPTNSEVSFAWLKAAGFDLWKLMLSPRSSDFEFKLWPGITMTVREAIGYELG